MFPVIVLSLVRRYIYFELQIIYKLGSKDKVSDDIAFDRLSWPIQGLASCAVDHKSSVFQSLTWQLPYKKPANIPA